MMEAQYDNERFFNNYIKLREDKGNYNDLFEQRMMMDLVGDFKGNYILDIGCGFGASAAYFADNGAAGVYGIDASEKMLALARKENGRDNIEYSRMDIENLSDLRGVWDIAFSSLVMHYVKDLHKAFYEIYRLLVDDGIFVFSMEHPITTATRGGGGDIKTKDGIVTAYRLDHYNVLGQRNVRWLDTDIIKYHRPVSAVLNALIDAGFIIERVEEPIPDLKIMDELPRFRAEVCRPSYLMIKAQKTESFPAANT